MRIIALQRGRSMRVSEAEGDMVARTVFPTDGAKVPRFLKVRGQPLLSIEVTGVYTEEQWLDMKHEAKGDWKCEFGFWHGQFESCGHVDPKPIAAPKPVRAATPWKAEQFAELRKFFVANMRRPIDARLPHRAWIETEEEFRAVMAGEKPWPERDADAPAAEKPRMFYRWVRKVVTEKAYHSQYAGRPVIEKWGTDVAIGIKRVIKPGESVGVFGDSAQFASGESWANAGEIAKLEALRGAH